MYCIIAHEQKHFYDQIIIRSEVFLIEQNVPIKEEIDELDREAIQFIVYDEDTPIGAARFRIIDNYGKIERVCVLKTYRNHGVGRLIMNTIEDYAKEEGIKQLKLSAQLTALPFYQKLGYTAYGDIYLDANIKHQMMKKDL
ncbi:MAG TPA: GNAT family N-acetyltransferase [Haloplasmataceae bacterium]